MRIVVKKAKRQTKLFDKQAGLPLRSVDLYYIIPHYEGCEQSSYVHSVWKHSHPDPELLALLVDHGYGSLGFCLTILASGGFVKEQAEKVEIYSPQDLNKLLRR